MKKYRHIIFDADHTLINFNEDEKRAFRAAFEGRAQIDGEGIEEMWRFSYLNWAQLGLNNVSDPKIRNRYHALYRVHVKQIFDHAEAQYGIKDRAAAEQIFCDVLTSPSHPVAGAIETVKELASRYSVSIATNGLAQMQHVRLQPFLPYISRLFISEEIGTIKPDPAFYKAMFSALNARAEECLAVGDSLTSDVAGARGVGMDCIWYNERGEALPRGVSVVAEIKELKELLKLL